MKKLRLGENKSALVIVAHPDDETIWMGGTVMRHRNVRWTIFSLCRASDADRAPKFRRVCRLYGAESIIADLDDEDRLSIGQTVPLIKALIEKKIGKREFDYLFTHGANGEYGHPRHKGVYRAVKELLAGGWLKRTVVFYFNYRRKNPRSLYSLAPKKDSDLIVRLSSRELARKKRIVARKYGYDPAGIDVGYCTRDEAFKVINNKN